MTDPEFADATFTLSRLRPEAVEKITGAGIEGTDAGGCSAADVGRADGVEHGDGVLRSGDFSQRYGVQMIGANRQAIYRGEDRQVFKNLMIEIGLKVPRSGVVHSLDDAAKGAGGHRLAR